MDSPHTDDLPPHNITVSESEMVLKNIGWLQNRGPRIYFQGPPHLRKYSSRFPKQITRWGAVWHLQCDIPIHRFIDPPEGAPLPPALLRTVVPEGEYQLNPLDHKGPYFDPNGLPCKETSPSSPPESQTTNPIHP